MGDRTSQATQLEFNQAMTDFKIMFPNMDIDVIEAVLRSNGGAVDTTIDQLLAMTADIETTQDTTKEHETPPPSYQNNLPSYNQAVKNDPNFQEDLSDLMGASSIGQPDLLSGLYNLGASGSDVPLCIQRGWKPPMLGKLPSNFLRIKGSSRHGHSYMHPEAPSHSSSLSQEMIRERMSENQKKLSLSSNDGFGTNQLLEDEKFALMLQNEEFMMELRGNHEFLSTLEEDELDKPQELGAKKGSLGMDDAAFREKLRNMGKQSKQKFTKLANMFTRQRGATRLLGHAPAPSKDNLLLNAEPLVDPHDSDSGSEDERHSTTKGRKYQLM
ncbi:CUE domain-containing protein 1 [Eurytemora carolleeae]|uniref:CUE domain-containing protein 1 n=1 Tax=Eurytemora carolleeae TaxID=1294199 RepID=UPI000C75BBFB|nr:CUE domain-containing protein 1 [Eurytemora carolleeae]|eukprot:XP_023338400.1 CUE domain-containing protein 1-like [Eurytemora affinis]